MKHVVRLALAASILLVASSDILAGLVKVSCDPGTHVYLSVKRQDGTVDPAKFQQDVNNDGIVEFGVKNQDTVKDLGICKDSDGRRIWYVININVGGTTLASLEPFDVPSFGAVGASGVLFAQFDIENFLNEGTSFTLGQLVSVTAGAIAETSTITFKDGTGLPDEPDFSVVDVDALPDFSGTVDVLPGDTFALPVPTLSEWGLIAMVAVLLGAGVFLVIRRV